MRTAKIVINFCAIHQSFAMTIEFGKAEVKGGSDLAG